MGPTDAPIVLLNLNPGYDESDVANYAPEARASMIRASLTHNLSPDAAFYFLDDTFTGTGGEYWWKRKLNPLIREVGLDRVRRRVQVIEYVPYKSKMFWDLPEALPSQAYTFALAAAAVARGAIVVAMRAHDRWVASVPQLAGSDLHRLKNPQNVTIGQGNCPTAWPRLIAALQC